MEVDPAVRACWPGRFSVRFSPVLTRKDTAGGWHPGFGAYLLVSGIAQVVFAFSLQISAGGRILLFVSGAASLILAVLAFRHFGEGYAVLLLAIWIAIGFIFRGVATTVSATRDPTLPGRGWNIFDGSGQPGRRHRDTGLALISR